MGVLGEKRREKMDMHIFIAVVKNRFLLIATAEAAVFGGSPTTLHSGLYLNRYPHLRIADILKILKRMKKSPDFSSFLFYSG